MKPTTPGASPPSSDDDGILAAAARLLASEGPAAVSPEAVARAAGISRSTVYRRYGGRARLLERLGVAEAEEDAHRRILRAARAVFTRDGLAESTIEQVAREAGVGPATVYRRFGDKAGLVTAFLDDARPVIALPEAARAGSLEEQLRALVEALLEALTARRDVIVLLISASSRSRELLSAHLSGTERTHRRLERLMATLVAEGRLRGDPADLTTSLVGQLVAFGVLRPMLVGGAMEDIPGAAARLVALFLDGARPRSPGDAPPTAPHGGA